MIIWLQISSLIIFIRMSICVQYRNEPSKICGRQTLMADHTPSNVLKADFNKFHFFFWVFFHEHSRSMELQMKGEGISLTPHYHFHPLHWRLDIGRAIAAGGSSLRIATSRARTRNLWFPSASRSPLSYVPLLGPFLNILVLLQYCNEKVFLK